MTAAPKKWVLWTGRILSALPCLMLLFSASMKLRQAPQIAEMWTQKFGYPKETLFTIGALEALCVVIYLVPQTAVLGAVLITGYMGGAVATHVRIGDGFAIPVVIGILVWVGVYLREPRLGALLPVRKADPAG